MIPRPWTPGPYSVSTGGSNSYRSEVVAKSPRGKPVVVARVPTPNRSPEQATANATLFAAAPELFDALDRLFAWSDRNHQVPPEIHSAALAVIRKVEGP